MPIIKRMSAGLPSSLVDAPWNARGTRLSRLGRPCRSRVGDCLKLQRVSSSSDVAWRFSDAKLVCRNNQNERRLFLPQGGTGQSILVVVLDIAAAHHVLVSHYAFYENKSDSQDSQREKQNHRDHRGMVDSGFHRGAPSARGPFIFPSPSVPTTLQIQSRTQALFAGAQGMRAGRARFLRGV